MVSIGYPDQMSEKKALVFPFFRRRYWGFAACPSGQSSLSPCHCLRKLIEPVTETLVHAEVFSAAHSAQQQAAATELRWQKKPFSSELTFWPSFVLSPLWNGLRLIFVFYSCVFETIQKLQKKPKDLNDTAENC